MDLCLAQLRVVALHPKGVVCLGWLELVGCSSPRPGEPPVACLCEAGIQSLPSEGPGEHSTL